MTQYQINYEVLGGKRNDFMVIYAIDMVKAIDEFEKTEIEVNGIKFYYNRHSIISIELYN